ncbi:Formate dehydrogenase-O major subunit precursor [Corynebacterium guangdongense]|uniref:Formate dehydrogenase major subunit n=1 Tax=Corynebacterium guangdongense TaxID=1783348 RepID=A0ABU1ZYM3_9CORY|nr:formate dehydrogenase major subunit [Corynebacterium guangdongense]WJZ17556.1 Formate dehydrogenase-O major subunit precursor [Corynebacterium guangdongense]
MGNSDCIIIQGSNMAENHPVGYQWVTDAKSRGAKVIHVDPRFTRTSAVSDRHIPIRAGSDVVLLGALINHVISNDLYFRDYVVAYTNAANLIHEDYRGPEDLDGLFSGIDEKTGRYDKSTWQYQRKVDAADTDEVWNHERDETLEHPQTVFQIMKRHYARYTPEMVEQACGITEEEFHYLADALVENSGRERTTVFAYALGWTQHTLGPQVIRASAILQLLMGNVGRPGGGVMALRGHASIQGSTDIPTLYHLLPGYLPMPSVKHTSFDKWVEAVGDVHGKGFWGMAREYAVSFMKAYFGENATAENEWGYQWLPRINGKHGTYQTMMDMADGKVDGYMVFGQNPAVSSINGQLHRKAFRTAKWMVVRDTTLIETANFWRDSPEHEKGEVTTEGIGTEVFFFPAAAHTEKDGTFTQTQRMLQYREKAVNPPGDSQSELDFFYQLGLRLRERLADSTDPRDQALLKMTWDYGYEDNPAEADANRVLLEINGSYLAGERAGEPLDKFADMKDDGSTSGGCWIYSGVFAGGKNQAANKERAAFPTDPAPNWGWIWPMNRRVLYNRASADPQGNPWSERKKYVWWDEAQEKWVSTGDVVDFPVGLRPDHEPEPDAAGPAALSGTDAFIMQADGKGSLFATNGLDDGPLPTHYEAQESRAENPLYSVQSSPSRETFARTDNLQVPPVGNVGSEVYPFTFTTYRVTEQHGAGGKSRWVPYLAELQPEQFCEVSPELAELRGLENGGWATIVTPRSAIEARVLVTERMKTRRINGKDFHQIGIPFHFANYGDGAEVKGDSANDLIGVTLEPNASIQQAKVTACDVIAGRRPRGKDLREFVEAYRERAGVTVETGMDRILKPGVEETDFEPTAVEDPTEELLGQPGHYDVDSIIGAEKAAESAPPEKPEGLG